MILNYYENSLIRNSLLPTEWQSQTALDELLDFLQVNWEQKGIFYDDGNVSSKQAFLEFTGSKGIKTANYIGTIAYKGHQLNIFPKVFKYDKDDPDRDSLDLQHLMYNLVRWIEYTTKIDYPYISISADMENTDNLQELFISLYIRYVKAALDRGLYFRYEDKSEDLGTIRGKLNIKDFYTRKFANGVFDKFNCDYSTFEFDNLLNRIIKCTLKYILPLTKAKNQKIIRNLLIKLGDVQDQKCTPNDCEKIQLSKMQSKYRIILSMSKMFLLNKSTNYNLDMQDSFCFLFPTEILFEGFIGGYLQSILKGDAKVKLQESEDRLFEKFVVGDTELQQMFRMRHDILIEHKEKGLFILDTKYKELSRMKDNPYKIHSEASIEDARQVISYAGVRGIKDVYLLFPLFRKEDLDIKAKGVARLTDKTNDIEIDVHYIRLPFVFEENNDTTIENLKKELLSIFE